MAKGVRIDLHSIDREVRAVQARLEAAAAGADSVEARRLAGIVRKLEGVRRTTSRICPKGWGVFPAGAKAAGQAPPKPATKKRR